MNIAKYRSRFYKLLKSVVRILVTVYIVLGLILYFRQSSFVFQPSKETPYSPTDIGLTYEKLQLITPDGLTLSGWYIPAKDAEYTLLFCHGNGGNISDRLDSIDIFNELGLNCLIFDYRGYGNSQGRPTEKGVYIDAQTAYDWLLNEKKIESEDIIIFGRSLGGSVAAYLAADVKAKSLILESPFTSFVDIGRKFYPYMPIKLLGKYNFNTNEYLKNVHCPVFIIHSKDDELVPFELGQRLYEKSANEPKKFLEISGDHNDGFLVSGRVYYDGLKNWLTFIENCHP